MSRFYSSWYNRPRQFTNGIVWVRWYARLGRRWYCIGGIWRSRHWPFIRILGPGRGRSPITPRVQSPRLEVTFVGDASNLRASLEAAQSFIESMRTPLLARVVRIALAAALAIAVVLFVAWLVLDKAGTT